MADKVRLLLPVMSFRIFANKTDHDRPPAQVCNCLRLCDVRVNKNNNNN